MVEDVKYNQLSNAIRNAYAVIGKELKEHPTHDDVLYLGHILREWCKLMRRTYLDSCGSGYAQGPDIQINIVDEPKAEMADEKLGREASDDEAAADSEINRERKIPHLRLVKPARVVKP